MRNKVQPDNENYKRKSTQPKDVKAGINTNFAYRQQSKLVDAAARAAINHVALAKRNRKDNQQRK